MRILTYTTLYPNDVQLRHGIFVEQRLRHLLAQKHVEAKVVAPVPWFPSSAKLFGAYGDYARISRQEQRHGIDIYHPRYAVIPKFGMMVSPALLAAASLPLLKRLIADGYDFDVLDAHYFYPDGVAAALLAKALGKPLVITARGTDINLIPQQAVPKKMILWAARQAGQIITVCEALRSEMIALGVPGEKIHALRNGVDLQVFCPQDRTALRQAMNLHKPTLLSVGHLIERKGHHLVIEALQQLPGYELLIAGDGEESANLQALVARLGLSERVRFLGALTHQQLRDVYNAADALVLASSREGWANVLLEAMACGTPVVATAIWGTPEVVRTPAAGVLVGQRTARALAEGVQALFAQYPHRPDTRAYAEKFSWDDTVAGVYALLDSLLPSPHH
ncbi:glycosyltransferase family 4 protein [Methylovulum psychrotolerans]|jgi:glycosyltransferase involved in cell wall biosynthesis|uniref:Glycosyltransferase family 4 protein n=1 Tax=Methylovulum psychrotolerans TaxID=1704499 RepID=A0A2S5CJR0_9GAMM|nr:glycosyltransferase family 4 protein [Methylovulum psychrotolerans]POZ51055.1 glycosyltransferase family 4 protein [Methylovulum psychrotolerans]